MLIVLLKFDFPSSAEETCVEKKKLKSYIPGMILYPARKGRREAEGTRALGGGEEEGLLRISYDEDDRRIRLGLEFSILGIFWVRKIWHAFFCWV